jgi:hypothetical protein
LNEEHNGKDYFKDQDDDDNHEDDIVLDGIYCREPDQCPVMGFCENGHEPLDFITTGII